MIRELTGTATEAAEFAFRWELHAREDQLPPPGDWHIWLALAGRGWGKTRTGAEWVRWRVATGKARRVALVAPTQGDARRVMVEGVSGIMAVTPRRARPSYQPSRAQLTWPNGAIGHLYSDEAPERLRGPEHDTAWADEVAVWHRRDPTTGASTWTNMILGLRLGTDPRVIATTTPKPKQLIRDMVGNPSIPKSGGSTYENETNLAAGFISELRKTYEHTTLGQQEIFARLLDEYPGSLWTRAMIETHRVSEIPGRMDRIVVAIDPAATSTDEADETAIAVAGRAGDEYYVLSCRGYRVRPNEWARRAVGEYLAFRADRIVGEVNNGGEMVSETIRNVSPDVPLTTIHASRGKVVRAEPISALYEQGRVHHVGMFADLEDQMCAFPVAAEYDDQVDAVVYALTELQGEQDVLLAGPVGMPRPSPWRT